MRGNFKRGFILISLRKTGLILVVNTWVEALGDTEEEGRREMNILNYLTLNGKMGSQILLWHFYITVGNCKFRL